MNGVVEERSVPLGGVEHKKQNMTSANATDPLSSAARNRRNIMEEKLIQKYLEQLEEGNNEFLRTLSPTQQWELGSWASHREKPLHLGNFDWNPERSDLTNLNRLFGARVTDYGWSVYDTADGSLVDILPFIMGVMAGLEFRYIGFEEETWYDADNEIVGSMDDKEREEVLASTFRLKIRFYPNRPGAHKAPAFCCPNNMETAESVLEHAQDRSWVVETRNRLWISSYCFTPIGRKYDVLSRLHDIEPRMTLDREQARFFGMKENHGLAFYKNSVLLVKYGKDVVAFGPEAILMA